MSAPDTATTHPAPDGQEAENPNKESALTTDIAEFAARRHDLDDDLLGTARDAFIDIIAVAVAGAREPAVTAALSALGPPPPGRAPVIGAWQTSDARFAALINGTAAHALDFDDVSHAVKGHPTTVIAPALLAVVDETTTGRDLLTAYAVGLQASASLWSAVGPSHYADGWHATSTLGVIGAAAAVSHLVRLDATGSATAIGIAASLASGLRKNFGTTTKPFHAGRAAEAAVTATRLAAAGYTADLAGLDGPTGFATLYGAGRMAEGRSTLEGPWILGTPVGINIKKYPCCYFMHRALDAVLELPAVNPIDISQLDVVLPPGSLSALKHPDPRSALEAKFSGQFLTAAAAIDRRIDLGTFTEPSLWRRDIRELMTRVRVLESDVPPHGPPEWHHGYAVVTLATVGGEETVSRVDVPRGDCRRPLSAEELRAKFESCFAAVGLGGAAAPTYASLAALAGDGRIEGWAGALLEGAVSEPGVVAAW